MPVLCRCCAGAVPVPWGCRGGAVGGLCEGCALDGCTVLSWVVAMGGCYLWVFAMGGCYGWLLSMGDCYGWLRWVVALVIALGGCYGWLRWAVAVGGCSTVDAGRLHRVCYFAC